MLSIGTFAEAVQTTRFFTSMRESMLVYPVVMSLHLSAIAFFGGLILMTDLRMLGLAMKDITIADMIRQTRVYKWVGFVVMVTCGILLAGSKLQNYYDNPYFVLKLSFLVLVGVHALIFRPRVYKNPEKLDQAPSIPRVAKVAAITSMVLWLSILSFGRWIAYYERPQLTPAEATHQEGTPPPEAPK